MADAHRCSGSEVEIALWQHRPSRYHRYSCLRSSTGLLFAVAEVVFKVAEIAGPAHTLVAIDVRNGQIRNRRSAEPPGLPPAPHQQRAALVVSQGMVYVAYGGLYGDCGNYRGTVLAVRTDGSGSMLSFEVPTRREGGIWAAPGAVVDAAGNLY